MMSLVERVAAAIAPTSMSDVGTAKGREYALERARAAIEAMREPTPEMVEAGYGEDESQRADCAAIYTAMITAALGREG